LCPRACHETEHGHDAEERSHRTSLTEAHSGAKGGGLRDPRALRRGLRNDAQNFDTDQDDDLGEGVELLEHTSPPQDADSDDD